VHACKVPSLPQEWQETTSGLEVVTVVGFPVDPPSLRKASNIAAQQLRWNLRNGKAGWLNSYRKGSYVKDGSVTS